MSNAEPAQSRGAAAAPECQVCPICMGLATFRQARPEALEHLMKAGAELLLAARALLEAGEAAGPSRRPVGMQRIRVG
jgi:hypothetical protein